MEASELAAVGLFAGLPAEGVAEAAESMRVESRPRGHILIEEGDIPDTFYVILSGHVTVHREGRHLADLGPGDFVGETGVMALETRNASVIATTPVRLAVAMGWEVRRLLDVVPGLRDRLGATAAGRAPGGMGE